MGPAKKPDPACPGQEKQQLSSRASSVVAQNASDSHATNQPTPSAMADQAQVQSPVMSSAPQEPQAPRVPQAPQEPQLPRAPQEPQARKASTHRTPRTPPAPQAPLALYIARRTPQAPQAPKASKAKPGEVRPTDDWFMKHSIVYHDHGFMESWHHCRDIKGLFQAKGEAVRSVMYPISSDDLHVDHCSFKTGAVVTFKDKNGNLFAFSILL